MTETAFKRLLEKRRDDYKKWVPVHCLALQDYVFFNSQGFNHLRFKIDNTPRNPKEAMYKLGLLPLVRSVIHVATKVEDYEKRISPIGGERKRVLREMEYWSLVDIVGKQKVKIRVVLRRIINSKKIFFWSVMKLQ